MAKVTYIVDSWIKYFLAFDLRQSNGLRISNICSQTLLFDMISSDYSEVLFHCQILTQYIALTCHLAAWVEQLASSKAFMSLVMRHI